MILRRITEHVKAQNWFAVALDFVIVVIGVGVAMYGQQWLSDRQQRANMVTAEAALQRDLIENYLWAEERLAVAHCRVETYKAIASKLLAEDERWVGIARAENDDTFRTALPNVFRSPSRNWGSRVWQAELGRGTFNQMADAQRAALDSIFKSAAHVEELQRAIYTLEGRLKILAVDTTIGRSDRQRYYDMLAEMDNKSGLVELIAGQIIERIEGLGIKVPAKDKPKLSEYWASFIERGKRIYGECYQPQDNPLLDTKIEKAKAP